MATNTNTLTVKAVYATVFLSNGSNVYLELEQGEDGVVTVKNVLNRAPGTNEFYDEYQAANQAAAKITNVFQKGN